MRKIIFIIIAIFFLIPTNLLAYNYQNDITIYMFYGAKCPISLQIKEFLAENVVGVYDNVDIKIYEEWLETKNYDLSVSVREAFDLNTEEKEVPLVIIGGQYIVGFSDGIGENIIEYLEDELYNYNYIDVVERIISEINFNTKTTQTINSKGVIVNYYTNYTALIIWIIILILVVSFGVYFLMNNEKIMPKITVRINIFRKKIIMFKDKLIHQIKY